MHPLSGDKVTLRALEPSDIDRLFAWENDPAHWRVSTTLFPFSRELLTQYIQSAQDIYTTKQMRFIIVQNTSAEAVGTMDLFDFSPKHQCAEVGVLVDRHHRGKGYASEALQLAEHYALRIVGIRNLFCMVLEDNPKSIALFEQAGYAQVGRKLKCFNGSPNWLDELMYQKTLI